MIQAEALRALDGVAHGYFTRAGGVSRGLYDSLNIGLGSSDDRVAVLENRGRVADRLGVAREAFVMPYQVHSPDVATVTEPWAPDAAPRVDALVTDRPGLGIGVSTADCGPILFAEGAAGVVGAAHAGWKGALTGVLEATIAAMEALGARRERITAVLGPTISGRAYEVGPKFVERFVGTDPALARFFRPAERADHAWFDLPAYIVARLTAAGVGHAENLDLCTYSDETRFFSYRRMTHRGEADYGRLVSAIAIREDRGGA